MPTLRPRKGHPEEASNSKTTPSTEPTTETPTSTSTSASTTTNTHTPGSASTLKKRATAKSARNEIGTVSSEMSFPDDEERPLLGGGSGGGRVGDAGVHGSSEGGPVEGLGWAQRNRWIVFALASGACAAFNGVFAKLTTTELTTRLSLAIAGVLGLESVENVVEFVVRGSFFGLNLVFNGVMWTLFTAALAKGNSTTQVSIMNTSTNFVLTAILGFAIFSEALPPLWWLGAAMLVAGNVIIGSKDEGKSEAPENVSSADDPRLPPGGENAGTVGSGRRGDVKDEDEDVPDLGIHPEL